MCSAFFMRTLNGQERVRVLLVEAEREQMAAGLEPVGDGRGIGRERLPAAGADDEDLVGSQVCYRYGCHRECRRLRDGASRPGSPA